MVNANLGRLVMSRPTKQHLLGTFTNLELPKSNVFTDFKKQRIEGPCSTVWKVGNAFKTETVWTAVRLNKQNDNFCTRKWLVIAECLKVPFHFLCVLLGELSAVSIFRDHPPPSANIHSKQLKSPVTRKSHVRTAMVWISKCWPMVIFKELPELTQTSDSNCGLYTILLGFVPSCLVLSPFLATAQTAAGTLRTHQGSSA